MALSKEDPCICIQCEGTIRFCTSNENEKRRHVAIVHGKETFSSLRCGTCERKYFDLDHFTKHLETSPECPKDNWMIKPEPLSAHLEMAFAALVEQMMRPMETDRTEKVPNNGGNGEGKMDRTSGQTWKRSMDGAKRKRVEDTSASDDPSSTRLQRPDITKAVNVIRKGKGKKKTKASMNIGRVGKDGKGKGQRSNDADGSDGSGTGNGKAIADDSSSVNEQFNVQFRRIRREYCLELMDKFSTADKLQCQLCSVTCGFFRRKNTNRIIATTTIIQHALGHLKRPTYRCRICNITKFTSAAVSYHVRLHHPNSEEGYEDCSDQYHQEIMDTLRLCYHVDKKKRAVGQVEKKLTIPGKLYKATHSLLQNERLHYIRSLAAHYSDRARIVCQLCSKRRRSNSCSGLLVFMRQHALMHLNKDIFQCVLCGQHATSYALLTSHLYKYHQEKSIEGAYMDYTDNYHQGIMNMLGKCFDPDNGNGVVKSKKAGLGISGGARKKATSGNGTTTCGTGKRF